MASFQPFAAAKAQGKAYSEAAKGQKGHQMGQPFMSVFAAFVNGPMTENPGGTGLAEVEVEWLNQFRKQFISASDVGWFLERWNIRETHPKGRPARTLVRYRMRTPDPAFPEEAGTHSPQSFPPSKGDRTGRPGTTNEQRAKDTESIRASLQESGGQVHQLEDEIDIYETDLAESMAILGFGEDHEEHTSFQ